MTVLARWDWFSREGGVWAKSLEVYRDACLVGSDSQEVALSGVDGITTMVLLVGRMGLKSVQVRAGAGMKIVDGTLQRSPSLVGAAAAAPAAAGPGAAAGAEDGAAAATPEFAAARPALYGMAWAAMVEASRFGVDASGDVAPAFVQGLAAVYKAGVEEGAELSAGQEGEEERMRQLFEMLDGLFKPRVPAPGSQASDGDGDGPRRPVYLPKVGVEHVCLFYYLIAERERCTPTCVVGSFQEELCGPLAFFFLLSKPHFLSCFLRLTLRLI